MFNNKLYIEVNREERFFCALIAHALLSSISIRNRFIDLVNAKLDVNLRASSMEVFLEAAALRDYWNDLGNAVAYTPDTHARRKEIILAILENKKISVSAIDQQAFFWTGEVNGSKLWNPGHWDLKAIKAAGLDNLKQVKWALNAKPDMLIISDSTALMIEAKIESAEGRDGVSGYRQLEVQEQIAQLLSLFVPQFRQSTFKNVLLSINPTATGISWQEILIVVGEGEIDEFSQNCLSQLKRY
jgi:hypothetical protein